MAPPGVARVNGARLVVIAERRVSRRYGYVKEVFS